MLLTEKVIMRWVGKTKQHYIDKGYSFTKIGNEFEVKVKDLTKGSHVLVEVKCDCIECKNPYLKPIEYCYYLKYVKEDGKYYCQECATKFIARVKMDKTILLKSKSFEQWCYDNNRMDVLDRWDYELNNKLPSEICYSSGKKFYFKCPKGIHESELKKIHSFTRGQEGNMYCKKCNSFAQWGIDNICEDFLEKYWNYEKNVVDPWTISYGGKIKVWIHCNECEYHGSYKVTSKNFTIHNSRCPYCCNFHGKVHPKDSLGQYIIDNYGEEFLNKIWSDKNNKSPFEYSPKSHSKVWWKCLDGEHKDYFRKIQSSTNYDFRCSDCVRTRDESILQEKTRLYLEGLGYKINHENDCFIMSYNPTTTRLMPYDNEVIVDNGKFLIVEVNGQQHYQICGFHELQSKRNNTTPQEEFEYQQWKDEYKKQYALSQGYDYLEVPFWTDNEDEEWKELINNKINEILNKNNKNVESEMM